MTAEFIYGVKDVFLKTALEYIGDVITEADKAFRRSNRRLAEWVVVKADTATKTTHIGDFSYEKTLFKNKTTGERKYLVDVFLGFEPHDRLTEDALAEMSLKLMKIISIYSSRSGREISELTNLRGN